MPHDEIVPADLMKRFAKEVSDLETKAWRWDKLREFFQSQGVTDNYIGFVKGLLAQRKADEEQIERLKKLAFPEPKPGPKPPALDPNEAPEGYVARQATSTGRAICTGCTFRHKSGSECNRIPTIVVRMEMRE